MKCTMIVSFKMDQMNNFDKAKMISNILQWNEAFHEMYDNTCSIFTQIKVVKF